MSQVVEGQSHLGLTCSVRLQSVRETLVRVHALSLPGSSTNGLQVEFNVEKVHPIEWSDEPYNNLVLPGNRRDLLKLLAEAHNSNLDFDDFVQGKGQGLVINLFGPPGVGKTLSAEATSEHLRRPLYDRRWRFGRHSECCRQYSEKCLPRRRRVAGNRFNR